MSAASELIERMERETGQRVDSNGFDNNAVAGLLGAMLREMGQSRHRSRDDVAAGTLARYQMSPTGQAEREANEMFVNLLLSGLSPDEAAALLGGKK